MKSHEWEIEEDEFKKNSFWRCQRCGMTLNSTTCPKDDGEYITRTIPGTYLFPKEDVDVPETTHLTADCDVCLVKDVLSK
jgi:hypothetical protein